MSDNLPPGCTDRDIDQHFGDPQMMECPLCDGRCEVLKPNPTPWQWLKSLIGLETFIVCPECDGDGDVQKTEDDFQAEQEFYDEHDF